MTVTRHRVGTNAAADWLSRGWSSAGDTAHSPTGHTTDEAPGPRFPITAHYQQRSDMYIGIGTVVLVIIIIVVVMLVRR